MHHKGLVSKMKGFSLVELMIVLAIVAILAVVGGTSYQSYSQRGNRADAQRVMMEIAAKQEQFMMVNQAYSNDLSAAGLNYDVNDSVTDNYTIITVPYGADPERFYVRATGIGQMAGEILYLYSTGQKTSTPAGLWE